MSTKIRANNGRKRRLFSSIGAKITVFMLVMGGLSALIGVTSATVFTRVEKDMTTLTDTKLPTLEQSSHLVAASDAAKNAMIGVLLAQDQSTLSQEKAVVQETSQQLNAVLEGLSPEFRKAVETDARNALSMLENLVAAKSAQFRNEAGIATQLVELQTRGAALQAAISELAGDANFDLSLGGTETMDAVETTLSDLVDKQFVALQGMLEAQAEVNLLSGTLLSMRLTNDPSTRSILSDLTTASLARLQSVADALDTNPFASEHSGVVRSALQTFTAISTQKNDRSRASQSDIFAARRDTEQALAGAVDDMIFNLTIAAEEASSGNRDAIQGLLDNQVTRINRLFLITNQISRFQEAALRVAVAPGISETSDASLPLSHAGDALSQFSDFADGVLKEDLSALIALSETDGGLSAYKTAALSAATKAAQAARSTSKAILTISRIAAELGADSRAQIDKMAAEIKANTVAAKKRSVGFLAALGTVALIIVLLTRAIIQKPLQRISEMTERLAGGDLQEVSGFDKASEEIARIARALSVFRDGLIEKQELSRIQEAERKARTEEQIVAVAAIGEGLERLSQGDLSRSIEVQVSEGFSKLRDDFNSAQNNLRELLSALTATSSGILQGVDEIGASADDLSRRTENQAATLEQSVAALDQVTANVNSSASNARDVETSLQQARDDAEQSGAVVRDAIDAMKEIKSSSDRISRIVSVIDDIAFQTNLLALNAGVEAARAGSAGSGFAVVASEVRNLAQRSSESAMEIKTLINDSTSHVDKGVGLVGETSDALLAILERFGEVSGMVTNIAQSANEQAISLKEVNTAMTQLDRVTQDNAAMVQQSAAATTRLNSEAGTMASLAARFVMTVDASDTMQVDTWETLQKGDKNAA